MLASIKLAGLIIGLTLLSGYADAQGFLHASSIWAERRVIWPEVLKSALWFASGIVLYWIALRFLREAQIVAPEIQTAIWFSVTIVGVALVSGQFTQWRGTEQLVAVAVILGIGWLMLRTAS